MKNIFSQIISLVIILTGYCPSILSGNHQMMMNDNHEELNTTSTHQQMSCCEGKMPEVTDAVLSLNSINEFSQAILIEQKTSNETIAQINLHWRLTGHNSSPPHLYLTGTTIMRE